MTNGTINITLQSPELVTALNRLIEVLAGKHAAAAPEQDVPAAEPVAAAAVETVKTTFEEVHATLVKLKQQKGSTSVREILEALGYKTVQDIHPEKFAEVLQMAAEKLGT